jgi:zinc/manganese transport system permease protein
MPPLILLNTSPSSLNLIQEVQHMFSVDFMQHAFLAGTVLAIVAGLVGYFIVLRHLVFAVEALSHVTFTGALLAAIVGQSPLVGLFGATALVALAMGILGTRSQARSRDVEVGTVLAWVLGLGVLFLSIYTTKASGAKGNLGVNILFGSILGLQPQQVEWIVIVGMLAILAILTIARPLLFASLDPEVAVVRGLPVRRLNILFLILVAISVAVAVPAVGALLNSALIVTPAAIAQRLVSRPFIALLLSAALALLFTWLGITIGFYAPVPISFLISTIAFFSYVAVMTWQQMAR